MVRKCCRYINHLAKVFVTLKTPHVIFSLNFLFVIVSMLSTEVYDLYDLGSPCYIYLEVWKLICLFLLHRKLELFIFVIELLCHQQNYYLTT